ncbi:zinc-dependent alcohol dehydrogenase [Salibacterium aidingense]|uniref:zinc-dependent alcohol dehydrogenase n=1 Tax=Salibacterium aidingense TaxID=384933 RepID=UPI003BCC1F70
MKAIRKVKRKYGGIAIENVPPPSPTDEEVLIKIKTASICGSDLHAYTYSPTHHYITTPVTMGHECAGEIIEAGSQVKDYRIGDRVVVEAILYCGTCSSCMEGNTHLCDEFEVRGMKRDGVFTEQIAIHPKYLHKIPDDLPFDQACLTEPLAVAAHAAIDNSRISPGDLVLITGPGPIGMLASYITKAMGAVPIISGISSDEEVRLPLLRKSGFHTINSEKEDIRFVLHHYFDTNHVDVVLECSGTSQVIQPSLGVLRKGGTLTLVGLYSKIAQVDLTQAVRKEITIRSSCAYEWKNFEQSLKLLDSNTLDIDNIIAHYSAEDAEQAFEDAVNKKVPKPIFQFS